MSAALQLQNDAGLLMSNLHVLGQLVTSLNRMSSEVMRLAFDDVCGLHSGEAFSYFCTFMFYVAGLRFSYILYSGPLLGTPVVFNYVM